MRRLKMFIACVCTSTFFLEFAFAQSVNIYVSPAGNDAATGSAAVKGNGNTGPLLTIQAAIDKIASLNSAKSDTVYIRIQPGTYSLIKAINFNQPVKNNVPVVISGSSAEDVIISGLKEVPTDIIRKEGKYWKFKITGMTALPSQLWLGKKELKQSVYPATGWLTMSGVKETVIRPGKYAGAIADSANCEIGVDPEIARGIRLGSEGSTPHILIYNKWNFDNYAINSDGMSDNTVSISGRGVPKVTPWRKGTRYRISDCITWLQQGEWLYNARTGEIYYYPRTGEVPGQYKFSIPVTGQLLNIGGKDGGTRITNIQFTGITFRGAGYNTPKEGFLAMQAAASYDAAVNVNYADNIRFTDCVFKDISPNALWLQKSVMNSKVEACFFDNLGIGGVKIGEPKPNGVGVTLPLTGKNRIERCIIQNGGKLNPAGTGIAVFQSGENLINGNEISDFYYTGITMGWTWGTGKSYAVNNKVTNNHIHHIGKGVLDDMGGIYVLGNSDGTVLSGNIIHHIYSYDYGGWGIYFDQGNANIKVNNNLVMNTKSASFFQLSGRNNEVFNNVFVNADIFQLQLSVLPAQPDTSLNFHDNIIVKGDGGWFTGPWNAKSIYLSNNVYGVLNRAGARSATTTDFGEVKKVSDDNKAKYISYNDPGLSKDNYSMKDVETILNTFKVSRKYGNTFQNNKWYKMANTNKAGFYNGFTQNMKKNTLFRKDQIGR